MPLKVAIDATPLLGSRTGVGVFVGGLLRGLLAVDGEPGEPGENGLDLTGYGLTWRGRSALRGLLPPGVTPARRLPMPAAALLAMWSRLEQPPVEWWTGSVDVVHGTNFVAPPSRHAAPVVTVHDLTAVHYPELCTPASLRYPTLVKRALDRGAFVHTHTEFVAAEVMDVFGVGHDRVRAVPPGVDVTPPAPEVADREAERPYILAVGSVEPRKDLPTLVRAFDLVANTDADVCLIFAGQDAWGATDLDEVITASTHRGRIERTGWVTDERRASLLRSATVLAYPSRYEGFGLPPLEAMAAGVPVITTDAGSLPEVVGDGARLVPPRDPEALAEAIHSLLIDPDERAALATRGRVRAASFTWDRCARGLRDIYRDAARQ